MLVDGFLYIIVLVIVSVSFVVGMMDGGEIVLIYGSNLIILFDVIIGVLFV